MSKWIPSVLQGFEGESSGSMERALKQVKDLLEGIDTSVEEFEGDTPGSFHDKVEASIGDVEMMLAHIKRED